VSVGVPVGPVGEPMGVAGDVGCVVGLAVIGEELV
jgi:hypothetical protein